MISFAVECLGAFVMVLASFMLMVICHRLNTSRSNKSPLGFLAPFLFMIIFVWSSITLFVPRVLDSIDVLSKNVYSVTLGFPETKLNPKPLSITAPDGKPIRFGVQSKLPSLNGVYRIHYTPRTRVIVDIEYIAPVNATSPQTNSGAKYEISLPPLSPNYASSVGKKP